MRLSAIAAALLVTALSTADSADAAPITYTYTAKADIKLGSLTFNQVTFDLVAKGDTCNAKLLPSPPYTPDEYRNKPISMKITITGYGTVTLPNGFVGDNHPNALGFFDSGTPGTNLLLLSAPQFATFSLATSGGWAVSASNYYNTPVPTNDGPLSIFNVGKGAFSSELGLGRPCIGR